MNDISNKIQTTLKKNGNYLLLSNDQTREILRSQNIRFDTACMDVNCLAAFGKNTGVDFTIGGEIKLVPGGYQLKLILVGTVQNRAMNSITKKLTDNIVHIIQTDIPSIINDLLASPKSDVPRSLTVKSDVDSAIVYIDGMLVGKTPYTTSDIAFGEYTVKTVNTIEFKEQVEIISITRETPAVTVEANFRFKLGKLYVSGLPYGAELTINNLPVGVIPYKDTMVFWGSYNVKAHHIGYYSEEVLTEIGSYNPNHIEIVLKRKSPALAAFYSFVIPGWGQSYSEHWKRALAFPIIVSSAIAWSVSADREYSKALDNYDVKRKSYFDSLNLNQQIKITRLEMDNALDEANQKRLIGFTAVAISTALWIFNVMDAYMSFPPAIRDPWESEKAKFPALSYSVTENALIISMEANF